MSSARSVFAREDTLFGACQGLADDFGFNPLWVRLPFALLLFWSPTAAFAGYAALCGLVMISRLIVREPRVFEAETPEPSVGDAQQELPLAA